MWNAERGEGQVGGELYRAGGLFAIGKPQG
jgi:hypothetical protein